MFTKDTRTENFLTQMGVEFEYANRIPLSGLVPNWREINLARPIPLRDEAVLEYAALMTNGSAAPAPILHKSPQGFAILDGVQRIAAAELSGDTGIAAYVVKCNSDDVLLSINVLANARLQGRAEPAEWTRRRAVEVLVVGRKLSVDEVARMGGWRRGDIQAIANALEWRAAVQAIGGPDLPDSVINLVADHVSQRDLQSAAVPVAGFLHVLKDAKFSAEDASHHIEDFFKPIAKDSKRFQVLTERLEAFRADPEVQIRVSGRKGATLPHDVNLRRAMRSVLTILGEIKRENDRLLYVDEFFKLSADIDHMLHDLAPLHQKPAAARTAADTK